ncbi:hypothetical protein FGO68_gene12609 [Halteria grandinella]|uniref:Peroxisomal biogenesis factor 11 n=1 Tax=Halteria grandinella TaxID=5974 RepID=A0A8J8SXC1_HALGN|nr:hypothetical protein FGO68_gene12609 [Halteria grandinella]
MAQAIKQALLSRGGRSSVLIRPEENQSIFQLSEIQGAAQNTKSIPFSECFTIVTNSYEGRDKVTKFLQFFAKYLAWKAKKGGDALNMIRYLQISETFRDARSVFRLSKSIFEIKRIKQIFAKTEDPFGRIVNVVSRVMYFAFWLLDNIYILLKMTNQGEDGSRQFIRSLSKRFQFIGQLLFLIYCLKTLRRTYTDESDLKVAALNKMTVKQMQDSLEQIKSLRSDYLLLFGRALSDFIISINHNDLYHAVFGVRMNHGVEGILGMISAVLYIQSLIRKRSRSQ